MSIFINYDGILGECSDSGHERWMEASNISWGTDRKISSHTSTQGDRESSNAVIHDLLIVRNMDIATRLALLWVLILQRILKNRD